MDNSIREFTKALASFCNHVQSTSAALTQSVDRRPVPLDSASSTFVQCLNRRVSAASADLNLLESMSFGTVSFEELLGHVKEINKQNECDIAELEDHLKPLGYLPELEIDGCNDDSSGSTPRTYEFKLLENKYDIDSPIPYIGSIMKGLNEDALTEDSLNLKSLGLSDACLATLASDANCDFDAGMQETLRRYNDMRNEARGGSDSATKVFGIGNAEIRDDGLSSTAANSTISISTDDYEILPSFMKSLVSWEDLLVAVEKMNASLAQRGEGKGSFFFQDELAKLLGVRAKSYQVLLLRMERLIIEMVDGLTAYRVL